MGITQEQIIEFLVHAIERERKAADYTSASPEARQYFDGCADAYEHVLRYLTNQDYDAYHTSKYMEPPVTS